MEAEKIFLDPEINTVFTTTPHPDRHVGHGHHP
jgi:hypothetical protein